MNVKDKEVFKCLFWTEDARSDEQIRDENSCALVPAEIELKLTHWIILSSMIQGVMPC